MAELRPNDIEFLSQLNRAVDENMANEQFGVSELADKMNMSRSNLLLKVKKLSGKPVNQLIRQIRLGKAMILLRTTSMNVSEVSERVGFGSTSYFIKCFREHYGYPPGEAANRRIEETIPLHVPTENRSKKASTVIIVAIALTLVVFGVVALVQTLRKPMSSEKSVVVLPFKNDSNDSTNVYLINGLMEATLNNLQKIKNIKVVSRTTSEKYRNTTKSIPEMAREMNVGYFVEGSGQRIGNQILLNIQLIESSTDKHVWARQYRREVKDIFALQQEIAENIANEIKVIITPDVKSTLSKKPTDDPEAYDLYLKGRDLFLQGTAESLLKAIPYFNQAIEKDNEFALAYGDAALVFHYLDLFQINKRYEKEFAQYADKAMLYDPRLPESLIAKALVYIDNEQHQLAAPYLEKALEYNPNSGHVISALSDLYNMQIPNTVKYLDVALKGVALDVGTTDSLNMSHRYLHLGNAYIQAGFPKEAMTSINTSLSYNPRNIFSHWVQIGIQHTNERNLDKTRERLTKLWNSNAGAFYILQEVGKTNYLMRDYDSAWHYLSKFIEMREGQNMKFFEHGDITLAIVLSEMGMKERSEKYLANYKEVVDRDSSIYHHLNLAMYYAWLNDRNQAMEHLKLFAQEDNYQSWMLLLDEDPVVDSIKDDPEFKKVMEQIKAKFWKTREAIEKDLKEKGVM